jgi:5-methylcytosine-specific restriction endonuclease McrA
MKLYAWSILYCRNGHHYYQHQYRGGPKPLSCPIHRHAPGARTGTTSERGYGSQHQGRRRELVPLYLGRQCTGGHCPGTWMNSARGMHLDHIKPLVEGGKNDPSNTRMICAHCNSVRAQRLSAQRNRARRQGMRPDVDARSASRASGASRRTAKLTAAVVGGTASYRQQMLHLQQRIDRAMDELHRRQADEV